MGNPYFKTTYDAGNNEAELYRQATDELCEMLGIDFKYVPKTLVKPDYIFGEDTLKSFGAVETVTLYIENYENFDGVGDMFAKFGFEVDNRLVLLVEQRRFDGIVGRGPEVDDLVYHQPSGKIFKVSHLDHDENFYQMNGGQDRYKITCELFTPSHEDFDTNISDIDAFDAETDSNTTSEKDQFDEEIEDTLNLDESDLFNNL